MRWQIWKDRPLTASKGPACAVGQRWCRIRGGKLSASVLINAGMRGGTATWTRWNARQIMNSCAPTAKSRSRPMGTPAGNIAPMRVMWLTGSGVARMSEEQFRNEKMYHATMNIAKSLMEQRAMTAEEYGQIDTIFRKKYRPILVSLRTEISGYKAGSMASCDTDKEG